MKSVEYRIDSYVIEIYSSDQKGARTRWGERIIRLFSLGKEVAQAVFAREGTELPEPYLSAGKIYYFAPSHLYADVLDLLRNEKPVCIAWKPIPDPKEPDDGDAYFYTDRSDQE